MTPSCWGNLQLKCLYRRRDTTGRPDLPLLSVYRDLGVVAREGRDDNWNKPGDDLSAYRVVRPGDLVLNKMKTWQGSLGVSALQGIVSPAYFVCEQVGDGVPRFLHHLLRSQPLIYEYGRRSKGIRPSQWDLPWDEFRDITVGMPPPLVQRAIADYLDAETARIDALIEKKRRMVELLVERFAGAVFYAVTGGVSGPRSLKASGLSWVDAIPSGWGTPTVAMNFSVQLGKMLNPESASGSERYPYLRNANVQWDDFDLDDLAVMHFDRADRVRCELRAGDLLVCEGGEVGRAAVWDGRIAEVFFQKAIHRVRPLVSANTRYLMYCLMAAAKQSVFAVEGNLSTIVHLTGDQLRAHRFPWPSLEEQARIAAHLDEAGKRSKAARELLKRQLDLLAERRQALVTAAVTGELAIPGIAA